MRVNNNITKINLLIFLTIFVVVNIYTKSTMTNHERGYALLAYLAMGLGLQFLINLLMSYSIFSKDPDKKERGKIFLLNALIILLIAFPSCIFNTSLI